MHRTLKGNVQNLQQRKPCLLCSWSEFYVCVPRKGNIFMHVKKEHLSNKCCCYLKQHSTKQLLYNDQENAVLHQRFTEIIQI